MTDTIVDVTDNSFGEVVLDAAGPVLVDFWAEWNGPSKMIAPVLEEIAVDYAGRLTIAKLNIDQNPATAPQYDVRALPTLLLFQGGQVTATHAGAISKGQLEEFLEANL